MSQLMVRAPILTSLIRERPVALAITGLALVQELFVLKGWSSWPCPMLHLIGIPCPACGLSRAIGSLLHGDWAAMLRLHAFAPVFAIALIVIAGAAVMPTSSRRHLQSFVETIERRTGVSSVLLVAFLVYWAARLTIDLPTFIQIIRG